MSNDEFASREIRITYEGPDLESHSIDAEAFAQSIAAASRTIKETARALYGYEFNVQTRLRTLEPNCISADLSIFFTRTAETLHLLTSGPIGTFLDDVLKLLGYIGGAYIISHSIYAALRWIKNRSITGITKSNEDMVTLQLEDGETQNIPLKVYDAISNKKLLEAIGQHMQILKTTGIQQIRHFMMNNNSFQEGIMLTKPDMGIENVNIAITPKADELDLVAELDRPSFLGASRGWKLVLMGKTLPCTITIQDQDFLDAVKTGALTLFKGQKFNIHLIEKKQANQKTPKYDVTQVMPITHG